MFTLSAIAIAAVNTCVVPVSEARLQETLPYEAFDSREGPYGWRSLNGSGCTDAALALISSYAVRNQSRLNLEQRLELAFHSGQALAFAGREKEAIPHFERAYDPKATDEWRNYVAATVAFLKHDARALAEARDAYKAIAPSSMRLRIIDGLVACPNEPYSKAAHCKM